MYELRKETEKTHFLDYLVDHAHESGPLILRVVSLPSFLDSALAINIFLNQMRTYPRPVLWQTRNDGIYAILKQSKLSANSIDFQPVHIAQEQNTYNITATIARQLEETILRTTQAPLKVDTKTVEYEKLITIPNDEQPSPDQQDQRWKIATQNHQSDLSTIYDDLTYTPPPVVYDSIDSELVNAETADSESQRTLVVHEQPTVEDTHSMLDQWLESIEKAKSSLENVKKQHFFGDFEPAQSLKDSFSKDAAKYFKRKKDISITRFALATITIVLLGALAWGGSSSFFGAPVYTIQVKKIQKPFQTTLTFDRNELSTQTWESTPSAEKQTTGVPQNGDKKTGIVSLRNSSNQTIPLENARFYFVHNGSRYIPKQSSSLGATFLLPANTNSDTIQFTISAVEASIEDIPSGTRMELYTLQGRQYSRSVYAVVSSPVTKPITSQYVTQNDLDTLKSEVENKLNQENTQKLKSLDTNTFSHEKLISASNIKEEYSAQLNQSATTVSLNKVYKHEMITISRDQIEETLESQYGKGSLASFLITSAEIDKDIVTIQAEGNLTAEIPISLDEVSNLLKNQDTASVKTSLQSQYEGIHNISLKSQSFNVFNREPKVQIEVIP